MWGQGNPRQQSQGENHACRAVAPPGVLRSHRCPSSRKNTKNRGNEAKKSLKTKETVLYNVPNRMRIEYASEFQTDALDTRRSFCARHTSRPGTWASQLWPGNTQNRGNEAKKSLKTKEVTIYKVRKRTRNVPAFGARGPISAKEVVLSQAIIAGALSWTHCPNFQPSHASPRPCVPLPPVPSLPVFHGQSSGLG